ncbi:hypothetical protein FGIG_04342 [Fasciola gigantica]|uniref:Uncharacterized protein n=1 Tax=Fasciola gigantica TaxID=46835 RepID=A0A504YIN9_FASGI|nr:hypothetical protein FGIG_04342 [Fasciola gigantica]
MTLLHQPVISPLQNTVFSMIPTGVISLLLLCTIDLQSSQATENPAPCEKTLEEIIARMKTNLYDNVYESKCLIRKNIKERWSEDDMGEKFLTIMDLFRSRAKKFMMETVAFMTKLYN